MAFDKVPDVIANYDICVVRGMKLDANVISLARQLKLIVQFGVGLEGMLFFDLKMMAFYILPIKCF